MLVLPANLVISLHTLHIYGWCKEEGDVDFPTVWLDIESFRCGGIMFSLEAINVLHFKELA